MNEAQVGTADNGIIEAAERTGPTTDCQLSLSLRSGNIFLGVKPHIVELLEITHYVDSKSPRLFETNAGNGVFAMLRGQMEKSRYENPIPTRASKANVWAFAEEIAHNLGFEPGNPIEPIVAEIGGRISYDNPIDEDIPETIRVEPSSQFEIFLPALTSATRDRFTIAHELGHLFLHFPLVQEAHPGKGMRATRWVDATDPDLERCEWEANWFAASFVMPAVAFEDAYKNLDITDVASIFGVSQKAVEIRAKSLQL